MIAPEELKERTREIKLYLAEDNVSKAVRRFIDFVTDFSFLNGGITSYDPYSDSTFSDYEHRAILLSKRYHRIEKDRRDGIVARDVADADQNRLTLNLLETMRALTGELYSRLKSAA